MRSISFPKIFNTTSTNIAKDLDATEQNLKLLLLTKQRELLGDPGFGCDLERYLFEPNNNGLDDLIIESIYTSIEVFMPQISVKRKDIKIIHSYNKVEVSIRAVNQLDFQINTYNLVLFQANQI